MHVCVCVKGLSRIRRERKMREEEEGRARNGAENLAETEQRHISHSGEEGGLK